MSLTCAKRLRKEMHKLQSSPPDEDIQMSADEDDIRQWRAYVRGPPDTPYAGGNKPWGKKRGEKDVWPRDSSIPVSNTLLKWRVKSSTSAGVCMFLH